MTKLKEVISLKNHTIRGTLLTGAAFIVGFIVLAFVSIEAWEFTNSARKEGI